MKPFIDGQHGPDFQQLIRQLRNLDGGFALFPLNEPVQCGKALGKLFGCRFAGKGAILNVSICLFQAA